MGVHERCLNLLACRYVDDVIIGAPPRLNKHIISTLNVSAVASTNVKSQVDLSFTVHDAIELGIHVNIPSRIDEKSEDIFQRVLNNPMFLEKQKRSLKKKENWLATRQYVQEL